MKSQEIIEIVMITQEEFCEWPLEEKIEKNLFKWFANTQRRLYTLSV